MATDQSTDPSLSSRVYALLTDDVDEARACEAIPEEACAAAPRSFLLNLGNGSATKLAEQVASPGLVLPLLLATMAAPVAVVGLLEPVRKGGSLLPQLAVSGRIRAVAVRKWFWVAAGVVQAAVLAVMALVAATASGTGGGLAVVGLLALFSMASGVGSVAFSDVVGKTVPKPRRGQLLALRATVGGVLTLGFGLALRSRLQGDAGRPAFVGLLLAAAALWALAAGLFAGIPERRGATEGGRTPLAEARAGMATVGRVGGFRRYVLARALLLAVEVALPFLALTARDAGAGTGVLGSFVVAVGVANVVGSPVWGRVADRRSTRLVMAAAGLVGALAVGLALTLSAAGRGVPGDLFALAFLLAGLAESGVRIGRKAYVVNAAPAGQRPLWVSASNTLAGVVALAFAVLGAVGQLFGVRTVLAVVLAAAVAGAAVAAAMPEEAQLAAAAAGRR